MKAYKAKAILYPLIGIGHLVFLRRLPNPFLAAAIAVGCFGLGVLFVSRWIQEG